MKKNPKSCTLLKRPKIAFLGEQKSATKKAPPSNSPDLFGGGAFLVARFRSVFFSKELPPEAEFFSGFGVRFERKPIENRVSSIKNPKIFRLRR